MQNFLLSFPPNAIAAEATRLDAQFVPELALLALNKPAGTPGEKIVAEINRRIAENQPSFTALALGKAHAIFVPEAEISGILLVAGTQTFARWRDALGSNLLEFSYNFLTKSVGEIEEKFYCDLPVAKHFTENRAVISSTTGKKSRTDFEKIAAGTQQTWREGVSPSASGNRSALAGETPALHNFSREQNFAGTRFEKWRAQTAFPRFHQIRLHAFECGIPILGDEIYEGVPVPTVASLRPKQRLNKGEDKPLYSGICLHLAEIRSHGNATEFAFAFPPPKALALLERKLGLAD